MKKIFILIVMIFTLVSCNNTENKKVAEKNEVNKKIQITTSIIPLASIANYIGGEFVESRSLVPSGVSPHSFDLKPNQLIDIEKSDLIVFLGIEHIDGFLNKAVENKKNVLSVKTGIKFIKTSENHEEHNEHKEEDEHHEEDENETHSIDPHIWGSSENAYIIAKSILDKLISIKPENKKDFEENLKNFKSELDFIKKDFEEKTKNKKQSNFIVFHDAYNYIFQDLNINKKNKHIFRKNLLNDPNSVELKKIIDEIKEENIEVAFKEPQLDASNLKNIASDYKLKIFILNPLGSEQGKSGYIENYKNNVKSLLNIYK